MPTNYPPPDSTPPPYPTVDTSGADVQKMSYQQIMPLLHRLEPDQFTRAAQAFKNLGGALENIRANIEKTGNSLAENQSWRGTAAQKAMRQFQKMHDQAAVLSAQSTQAGKALDWFGGEATPPFQSIRDPQVLSGWEKGAAEAAQWSSPVVGIANTLSGNDPGGGQGKADTAARSYLNGYNQQIAKLNQALPAGSGGHKPIGQQHLHKPGGHDSIQPPPTGRPPVGPGNPPPPNPGGRDPGNPANPFGQPHTPYTPNTPHVPTGQQPPGTPHVPGIPNDHARLQGFGGTPGGPQPPLGGGAPNIGGGGGGANPFGGVPMVPGGAGPGAGKGLGKGSAAENMAGENAGQAEAGKAEQAAAAEGRAGQGGVPLGGSGGGSQQDKERQRQAWLNEDDSIWGVPDEDVGPIIG